MYLFVIMGYKRDSSILNSFHSTVLHHNSSIRIQEEKAPSQSVQSLEATGNNEKETKKDGRLRIVRARRVVEKAKKQTNKGVTMVMGIGAADTMVKIEFFMGLYGRRGWMGRPNLQKIAECTYNTREVV
jgi:hypothetical protein